MINSSFRLAVALSLLFLVAPLAHAASPAAEQAVVEQEDTDGPDTADTAAPAPKEDKTPARKLDGADVIKDSHLNAPYVAPAAKVSPAPAAAAPDAPKHETPPAAAADAGAKPENAVLGSLTLRQPNVRLDQISLWREDGDKAAPTDVWDGTVALDVQNILPALVMTKNARVKEIILRIAMSGVYTPAGMTDIEYVHWRANVLFAQSPQTKLPARLMNAARLGRSSNDDLMRRVTYEIAAGEIEAACVESMATGETATPFWQGMEVLCAQNLGDKDATKNLINSLPDSHIKTAANANDQEAMIDAIIKTSGILPATKTIPDNQEILKKLSQLLSDIEDDDDSKAAATKNKGELLLLSLGALRATKHGDDTQKLTDQALGLAGF